MTLKYFLVLMFFAGCVDPSEKGRQYIQPLPIVEDERKYFLTYTTIELDGWFFEEFKEEERLLEFLGRHAESDGFYFWVVYGEKAEYEPAERVTKYERKDR